MECGRIELFAYQRMFPSCPKTQYGVSRNTYSKILNKGVGGDGSSDHRMKSVDRKRECLSVTIDLMILLFVSVSLAATSVLMVKTLSASETERVPSAESFLPVKGNVSGNL